MTSKTARQLLLARRPDGQDDSYLREALDAAAASPELDAETHQWAAFDTALATDLERLTVTPGVAETIATTAGTLGHRSMSFRQFLRNPATIAVAVGFFLLLAVMVWHLLGRAGTFPDDGIKIATAGAAASPTSFGEVESPVRDLSDWFVLKGFDDFRPPEEFENFPALGVRIFQVEGEPIAQVAVADDLPVYFYSFRAQPFGIFAASWRTTEAGNWALAIREEDGVCFLVTVRGNKDDLTRLLERAGVRL